MEWLKKTIRAFRNWPAIYLAKLTTNRGIMRHRNGLSFYTGNIRATLPIVYEVFDEDAYGDLGIAPGSVVIDIGANIGSFSLKALKAGAVVTAYEPSSATFQTLQKNVSINGFSATLVQKAVGRKGTARLAIGSAESGTNSLFREEARAETVERVPFAEVMNGVSRCDLMKIDCEGAEYDFILGASPDDLHKVRKFVIEWHDIQGHSVDELAKRFTGAGFSVRLDYPYPHLMTVIAPDSATRRNDFG